MLCLILYKTELKDKSWTFESLVSSKSSTAPVPCAHCRKRWLGDKVIVRYKEPTVRLQWIMYRMIYHSLQISYVQTLYDHFEFRLWHYIWKYSHFYKYNCNYLWPDLIFSINSSLVLDLTLLISRRTEPILNWWLYSLIIKASMATTSVNSLPHWSL